MQVAASDDEEESRRKMVADGRVAFSIEDEEPSRRGRPYEAESQERRCEVWTMILGLILGVIGVGLYFFAGDQGRWGSRGYAKMQRGIQTRRRKCDAGLQVSRMGREPPISHALCVERSVVPNIPKHEGALKFLVLGDWGRDGMCCQRDVANRMAQVASFWQPKFVMNTGDNFYKHGIESADDPQIASSWSGVYGVLPHLSKLPWLTVAGNHDHRGDVSAQLKLAKISSTWEMPSLTYFERRQDVLFSFLDTTPMYYLRNELANFQTNFSDSEAQVASSLRRLEEKLQSTDAKWKIVMGHHPLYSTGSHFDSEPQNLAQMQEHLKALLEKHKVSAYFCGHEHSLEHAIVNNVHYFVSGAGSKVREITAHAPENVFAIGVQGFMAVAIEAEMMYAYFIDMAGTVLHTAKVARPT